MTALSTGSAESSEAFSRPKIFDSVVIMSPYFWNFRDDTWQTTHQVARQFARLHPTVLVEPAPVWNFGSEQFRLDRLLRDLFSARVKSPLENLLVFHRRGLPGGRYSAIRNFDLSRNARSLRTFLREQGFRRTLLWHSFPYWSGPLTEAVDAAILAYHCLDYSQRPEEAELVRRADAVFCVSDTLVERHKALKQNTYLLPNGVDLDLFDAERAKNQSRPSDLPLRGRIIGFLGSINCHIDFDLLLRIARAFQNDSLVLIGRILTNETAPRAAQMEMLKELLSLPNVRQLGFKPTNQLPGYIHSFDVCLIPFLMNAFNQECDPLKFYQYLAMGKPVVATSVGVARKYHHLCYLSASATEFLQNISKAFDEPKTGSLYEARLNLARCHSWMTLLNSTCNTLESLAGASVA